MNLNKKYLHNQTLHSHVLRGGLGSIAIKLASMLIGFLLVVTLARVLGPADYGTYVFVMALITILAIPAQMGLPQLIIRETAKAQANANWGLMRGIWQWSNRYVVIFSIVIISGSGLFLWLGSDVIDENKQQTLSIGLLLIPLIALGNIRGAALRGLRKVIYGQLPEHILRPFLLLIFITLFIWLPGTMPIAPSTVMGMHAVAALIAFIAGAAMLLYAKPANLKNNPKPIVEARYWRQSAIPLAFLSGLQLINGYTDIIMLGFFKADEDVGVYRVVTQLSILVVFGLQAVNQVIQPYFARLYEQGEIDKLQKLVTLSARIILAIALPPVLLIVFAGAPLLEWLFGAEYRTGATALSILALGQLVNAAMGSVGMLLNMTGHERDALRGVGVAAVTNIIFNALLIPIYGIEGAAFATAITLITWNLILRYFVQQRLQLESSALGSRTSR